MIEEGWLQAYVVIYGIRGSISGPWVSMRRAWDCDGSVVAWVYGCIRAILDRVPQLAGAAMTMELDSLRCDAAATVIRLCCYWLFLCNHTGIGFS